MTEKSQTLPALSYNYSVGRGGQWEPGEQVGEEWKQWWQWQVVFVKYNVCKHAPPSKERWPVIQPTNRFNLIKDYSDTY